MCACVFCLFVYKWAYYPNNLQKLYHSVFDGCGFQILFLGTVNAEKGKKKLFSNSYSKHAAYCLVVSPYTTYALGSLNRMLAIKCSFNKSEWLLSRTAVSWQHCNVNSSFLLFFLTTVLHCLKYQWRVLLIWFSIKYLVLLCRLPAMIPKGCMAA